MSRPKGSQGQIESEQLEQQLSSKLGVEEIVRDPIEALRPWLKEDTPEEVVIRLSSVVQKAQITMYSGPVPHADQFAEYERAWPGAADRILGLAEREQDLSSQRIGLLRRRTSLASVISLALIGLAGFGIWQDLPWTIVVPFGLSGVITYFLRELTGMWTNRQ